MHETIEFKGTLVELKIKLNQQRISKFYIEWISESEFKFLAPISDGTAKFKGNAGIIDGIKGYAKITINRANEIIQIELCTKLRIELKFIAIFGIIWMICSIFSFKLIPILLIAVFPLAFAWMYKVYRKQEIELFENVKHYIRNN